MERMPMTKKGLALQRVEKLLNRLRLKVKSLLNILIYILVPLMNTITCLFSYRYKMLKTSESLTFFILKNAPLPLGM